MAPVEISDDRIWTGEVQTPTSNLAAQNNSIYNILQLSALFSFIRV